MLHRLTSCLLADGYPLNAEDMTATLGSFCIPPIVASIKIGSPMPLHLQAAYISQLLFVVPRAVHVTDFLVQVTGGMLVTTWVYQAIFSHGISTSRSPWHQRTRYSPRYPRTFWHIPLIWRNATGFHHPRCPCFIRLLGWSLSKRL